MGFIDRTLQSKRDAAEIWHFIATDNERAANRLIDEFDRAFVRLSDMPGTARVRPEFGKGVRLYPIGNYVIYYRAIPGGIEVLRIFHGARDIRSLDQP